MNYFQIRMTIQNVKYSEALLDRDSAEFASLQNDVESMVGRSKETCTLLF